MATTTMQAGLMAPAGSATGQALANTGNNLPALGEPDGALATSSGGLLAPVKAWAEQP